MPETRLKDRDLRFNLGMQSAGDPENLPEGAYMRAFNVIRRGGIIQCRPGYRQLAVFPEGRLQGLAAFQPTGGDLQLLVAVAGKVYMAVAPFDTFSQINGLQFDERSERLYFCQADKSVTINEDGSRTVVNPLRVLIIQDGRTAPGYWDGSAAEHILGTDTTPIGTVMAWSGGRLWVARDHRVFASDIYDPLNFTEGLYVGPSGIGAFIMPSNVTAIAEVPDVASPFLLVFTETQGIAIQSNIRQRDAWLSTPDFIKTVLPDVGCVAPFSVVPTFGYLWWFSKFGMTNLNTAAQSQVSSERRVVDTNMACSKARLDQDMSGVAACAHDGYLLVSVPYADRFNRHTWCGDLQGLDTTIEEEGPTWDSYWTGTRPVQWVSATVNGKPRAFHVSVDRDGVNRLWEAFQEPLDNGCSITWGFETRGYLFSSKGLKEWKYAKLYASELSGNVDFKVAWAGTTRGRYKDVMLKRVVATRGSVDSSLELDAGAATLFALKKQSRTLETQDARQTRDDPESSCGVESPLAENWDTGFQLCVMASGPGGIRSIRVFADPKNEELRGSCEKDETEFLATRFDGASSPGDSFAEIVDALKDIPDVYSASATVTETYNGVTVVGVGHAISQISQLAADKLAREIASMNAAHSLVVLAPPYFGGFGTGGVCFQTTEFVA